MTPEQIKTQTAIEKTLYEYDGPDQILESKGLLKALKIQADRNVHKFMKSGLPSLDDLIKGFYGGELTVISGPTKHGKTLFCQTLTNSICLQERKALWFTYEVSALQFLEQFGDRLPSFFLPGQLKSNALDWINQRVYEAKVKFGLDAVFIDHLHYLIDMNRHNISLEIGHVMRFLKKLALLHNIHIFLVAHLGKVKLDEEPNEADLRDSSFVGQECDNCLMLWRVQNVENMAIVKVALNRRFGVMGKKVRLTKIDYLFGEVDDERGY